MATSSSSARRSHIRFVSKTTDEASGQSQRRQRRRQGHLVTLMGFVNDEEGSFNYDDLCQQVAAFLAWKHLQDRSGIVLEHLPHLLHGCEFDWTIELRDTGYSPLEAARQLVEATTDPAKLATTTVEDDATDSIDWMSPPPTPSLSNDADTDAAAGGSSESSSAAAANHAGTSSDSPLQPTTAPQTASIPSTTTLMPCTSPSRAPSLPQDEEELLELDDPLPTPESTNAPSASDATSYSDTSSAGSSMTMATATPSLSPRPTDDSNPHANSEGSSTMRTVPPKTMPPQRTAVPIPRPSPPVWITSPPRGYSSGEYNNNRHLNNRQQQPSDNTALSSSVSAATENERTPSASSYSPSWQPPFAIVGAVSSSVTLPLTILGSAYELPQISGSATSAALGHSSDPPSLFARTIPTNAGDARAAMAYYASLGVTHVACLYIQDPWGDYYNAELKRHANLHGIALKSIAYTEDDIESSIVRLEQLQYRYIFAIMVDWRPVLELAYDHGIIGNPNYSWLAAEMVDWTGPDFQLSRHNNPVHAKFAQALNGIGTIMLHFGHHEAFEQAMMDFANNRTLQEEFTQAHPDPNLRAKLRNVVGDFPPPDVKLYHPLYYDAILAVGLAACQTPGLFTGPELYETMVHLSFSGVTGTVSFDPTTGSRSIDSVSYRIVNVFLSDKLSTEDVIRFESNLAALVVTGHDHEVGHGVTVEHAHRYTYNDNTTIPPAALPPLVYHDYNLIPRGAQIFGWMLAALVMYLSLIIIAWTIQYRNSFVVRVSPPFFVVQLCVGTLIMASAIIPMGFQGKETRLDLNLACMSVPWLVFVGFVIAFSALFSKTWKLNKLMNSGMRLRRIQVQAIDVLWPFVVLMAINVNLLFGWTLISPYRYHRIPKSNFDAFGRNVESYGICKSTDRRFYFFLIPILLVNLAGVGIATYHSWKGRNLVAGESSYLAMSMASLFESLVLGGPILIMVLDNPTAYYLVASALLFIGSMAILLPVFVPKYIHRKALPTGVGCGGRRSSTVDLSIEKATNHHYHHHHKIRYAAVRPEIQTIARPSRGEINVSHFATASVLQCNSSPDWGNNGSSTRFLGIRECSLSSLENDSGLSSY
jgi:hypothetical protein